MTTLVDRRSKLSDRTLTYNELFDELMTWQRRDLVQEIMELRQLEQDTRHERNRIRNRYTRLRDKIRAARAQQAQGE